MIGFIQKTGAAVAVAAVALGASGAFADAYYYSTPGFGYSLYAQSGYGASGACVNISRDLYRGMRGADVSELQRFLVSRNYPGGGAWMVTGYFGAATEAAVRNFQNAQALAPTGMADAATRAALMRVSCGFAGGSYGYDTYPYQYSYPLFNTYQYSSSCDGYNYPGMFSGYLYGGYPYGTGCPSVSNYYSGTSYTYQGAPVILALSPQSGAVGATVNISGYGFSTTGNTVHFGNGIIANVISPDGKGLSFTVPSQLSGYGSQMTQLAAYDVYVTTASGASSNHVPFAVTSLGSGATSTPSLSSLTPWQGPTGTQIVIRGSGFSAYDNTVRFGQGGTQHVPSFDNGTTIYYTIPAYVSACDLVSAGVCGAPVMLVTPGSYPVSVGNAGSISNVLTFTVQ